MEWLRGFFQWFAGGAMPYHTLYQCLMGDTLWITITVVLDLTVAAGYIVIASHWMRNERYLPPSPAKRAMGAMKNIFIFCGLCGYVFIPVKMFYPAWRLYDLFMAILAFYTWRYAWGAKDLKVIYNELGRTSKLAKELEASRAEVERRSEFLNAVSHDLRTPLNGLTLRTNLAELQLGMGDQKGLEKSLSDIRESARSVAEMLDQLLEYARIDRDRDLVTRERFSLQALAEEVVRDSQPAATEKKLILESAVPPGLIVETDRIKLKRVLNNLVTNAVKFTREGSVRIAADWRGRDLELHVIDTGVGIPPDKIGAIFEEFYQVGNDQRDRRQGFGMGLPIARQLTTKLGGEIQVHSTVGQGSRFTVVLPGVIWSGDNAALPATGKTEEPPAPQVRSEV